MIPIQIDSKTRVPKISKHLKILKMRSLEGCETKSMQNFGFLNLFLRGFGQFFGFLVHCAVTEYRRLIAVRDIFLSNKRRAV